MDDQERMPASRSPGRVSPEILDRLPPQNLDAEKAVLGSIMLDPPRLADVEAILTAEDFYSDAHSRLYRALQALCGDHGQLDTQILLDHLRQAKTLEAVGGTAYVAEVASSVPYAANADHYAAIVLRTSIQRQLIHIGTELIRDGYNEEDGTVLVERAEQTLAGIGSHQTKGPTPFAEIVLETLAAIDEAQQTGRGLGLPTGLVDFDEHYGGLHPGELFVLAARPSVGKTALALQITQHNAEQGRPVYFASAEMGRNELVTRMLCSLTGVDSRLIRSGHLGGGDRQVLADASNALARNMIYLEDRPGMTVAEIRRSVRRVSRGLRLVVVDYLQLLTPADRRVNREEQVSRMTRELKGIAREFEVPVLCLCQLNRQATGNVKPDLHHLRESGAIEQDADVVAFLHLEADEVEWIVRKNRNGPTGRFGLAWDPSRVEFT